MSCQNNNSQGFPICDFRGTLRILLDDWDNSVPYRFPNMILDCAVKSMVQLGKLNCSIFSGPGIYTITPDGLSIAPDWSGRPDGFNLFALGSYETALMFLRSRPDRYSFKTRQLSETFGNVFRYIEKLEADVHMLVNGDALFTGYQSYYSWLSGVSGLPVGEILAQFDVQSPLWKATFTRDGMRVA